MKVDKKISGLICKLEHIMGSQTYNPNSYNGWTGEEGCAYTFPVSYCKNEDDYKNKKITKTQLGIDYIEPECIKTMKYVFGANHLYVGDGIVEILNYLEETYNLDFNKLEQNRLNERKNKLAAIEKKLNEGETLHIEGGRKTEVGIDIPKGEYEIINLKERYSSYIMMKIYDSKGDMAKDIFSSEDKIQMNLEDDYFIKSAYSYGLKRIIQ